MKLLLMLILISIISGCAIVPAGGYYYEGYYAQPYPVYQHDYNHEPYRYRRLPHHHHNHW